MTILEKNSDLNKKILFVPKEWCIPLYIRNLRLSELLKKYVRGRVLDYGCAGGKRFVELHSYGIEKLISFDLLIDPEAISNRGEMAAIVQANGKKLPFQENSFDFILANQVLEHIDDIDSALKELQRVLKPDGKLIIGIPTLSTLTFYVYYPLAYILYFIAGLISRTLKEGGENIAHGKRLSLVGDKNVLKITNLFEIILIYVPSEYLKTVFFSWGFTLWVSLFNAMDHNQKHAACWWKKRLQQTGFRIEYEVPVGYLPLFLSNFFPKFAFPYIVRFEHAIQKILSLKLIGCFARDYFFVVKKK